MAATAERRIIVNADDYGFSPGVSAGILECVAAGVVTSVSVMVNTPGFEDGMRRLREPARPPGVGLHLNLTAGEPVAPAREVRSLVDASGRFGPLRALAARAFTARVDPDDVDREVRAQLERLGAAWRDVDHLDSHHHVHALPGIRAAVRSVAQSAGVRWVRRPVEPVGRHRGALKRLAIAVLCHAAPDVKATSVPVRGLGLDGGRGFLADLLRVLDLVEPGVTELVVHPGRAGPELAAWDPYLAQRDGELAALLSAPLRERLARGDIVLTDFRAA